MSTASQWTLFPHKFWLLHLLYRPIKHKDYMINNFMCVHIFHANFCIAFNLTIIKLWTINQF